MEDSPKSTEETEATVEERSVAAPPEQSSGAGDSGPGDSGAGDSGGSRPASGGGRGGWGGWGFTPLSYLSDLQKAAAVAAEEISRNAAAVAKSISERQNTADDSESTKEEDVEKSEIEEDDKDEMDKLRKSALDKLEKASEDSLLSQGLKVIDNSMENFASGAWQALGSALTGGSNFIQKLEHSAVNLAESLQHGGAGAVAPSLLETGKAFTAKGMQVLENVGKETMELLISETGIEFESNSNKTDHQADDQLYEEMTFDRCFYIYGGPEQLQELEALSNHCALLFNRRKAKLSSELRSFYEGRLKAAQQILDLSTQTDAIAAESNKGKKIETRSEVSDNELKSLHDSSISKAADMAAGFTSSLAGLSANDIIQRTAGRLESLQSEGVHRLSEICCFAVSQLLILGKSILSSANKTHQEESVEDLMNVEWPEDSLEKAKTIRTKAQSMAGSVEAVSNCFITGISDVAEAYMATIKGDSNEAPPDKSIQEKASALSEHLRADQTTAVGKIQDGLQYLSFVVLSTSMRPS